MRGLSFITIVISSLLITSCGTDDNIDMTTARNEVLSVLENYQTAHETQNIDLLRNCFSPKSDIIILGTDEKELWVERESLLQEQQRFYESVDEVKLSVRDKVVKMCPTGLSGWFYMRVNWFVKSGDDQYTLENIRTTGVMNKEDDQWGIVMMHTSMPVKGQAVRY
ncbi:MAG: nuclear transport factor 2 family protein [Ignavibacteriaceae bacterium]|nr:nuclear transport factor 2 family protein [Ignavibacteriaceae bacterium]